MGLELYFVDRETQDGPRVITSWSCQPHNHQNPSEWGTLELRRSQSAWVIAWMVAALFIVSGTVVVVRRTRRRTKQPSPMPAALVPPAAPQNITGPAGDAVKYLRAHFAEPDLDRAKVARAINISAGYLSQNFRSITGKSFPEYLNEVRIQEAAKLIAAGQRNMTEVALATGFSSLDHFIRQFKKIHGTTPKQFQQGLHAQIILQTSGSDASI
jgi:AraC-like DNA-binding protein